MPKIARGAALDGCRRAADLLLHYPWKLWFWGDSIGMEGLLDTSEVTGDAKYSSYVYGVFKGWIPRMEHKSRFEHTAPGAALVRSYALTGDPALLKAARLHADYLATFRRTKIGCPIHYEDVAFELPPDLPPGRRRLQERMKEEAAKHPMAPEPCVFVDSVHFQGPFLASLYSVTREERYLKQAESTIGPQVDLLWDKDGHLFHHFWKERAERRNGVFWGRGNCWALLGMLRTMEHLPKESPLLRQFRTVVGLQSTRLAELQDPSGDWHTVLDDPGSYLESSIAAFVVAGFPIAMRNGWISKSHQKVVDKAWEAMWTHLRKDGLFAGVSYETHPSLSKEHYRHMPKDAMVPWGQGPFLAACRSYLGPARG